MATKLDLGPQRDCLISRTYRPNTQTSGNSNALDFLLSTAPPIIPGASSFCEADLDFMANALTWRKCTALPAEI